VKEYRVGCDFDGVLGDGFTPEESEFIVLSGRTTKHWDHVVGKVGASRPIYLRPEHFFGEAAFWKATVIRSCGITKFYEDMPDQARDIRLFCPECVVVMVKHGKVVGQLG
jgi:ribosomal protein S27AE